MKKGFTIIELMIAIFILSVGILGVLSMFPLGMQVAKSSKMASAAIQLAQVKIEETISQSYETVSPGEVTESSLSSPFDAYKRVIKVTCIDGSDFSEITDCTPGNDLGLKSVEVIVFWGIIEKSVKITTLISQR